MVPSMMDVLEPLYEEAPDVGGNHSLGVAMSLGEDDHSQLGADFKVTAHECRPPVVIAQQPALAGLPGRATSRRWFCLSSSLVELERLELSTSVL